MRAIVKGFNTKYITGLDRDYLELEDINRKLTQEELSLLSGVNLRTIKSYEQCENDILKAQGETLLKLAKTLDCSVED